MKFKIVAVLLAFFMGLGSMAITPPAKVEVNFANGLTKETVPQAVVDSIVSSNKGAANITIYEVGTLNDKSDDIVSGLENTPSNQQMDISRKPAFSYYKNISTKKTVTQTNALAKDVFQFSVAKGQTVTLTMTYSASLTGSYSGTIVDVGNLGISGTVSGGYAKSTSYSGPGEGNVCNSRQFRTKFFENRGTYVQTAEEWDWQGQGVNYKVGNVTTSGTFKEATIFANYSVDSIQ